MKIVNNQINEQHTDVLKVEVGDTGTGSSVTARIRHCVEHCYVLHVTRSLEIAGSRL
jgi:hypothetical protein